MIESILILLFGLLPACLSLWMMRRAKAKWEDQLQEIRSHYHYFRQSLTGNEATTEPEATVAVHLIGDTTCRFNARSPYLRCALHPSGPCETCLDYEPRYRD